METMTRISIPVTVEEREALRAAAEQKMLDPRVHARYILRRALFNKSQPRDGRQPVKNAGSLSVSGAASLAAAQ